MADTATLEAATAVAPGRRPHADVLIAAYALLAPIAFSPLFRHPFWAPKTALTLAFVGPGLAALTVAALRGSLAARFGALFLACAGASAVVSQAPVLSFFGHPNLGTGVLFLVACLGLWALAREIEPPTRPRLERYLVFGVLGSAVVGVLEAAALLEILPGLGAGRAVGLAGNPVFLGALAAAALALTPSLSPPAALGAACVLAATVELSGGRSAIALGAVGMVVALCSLPRARRVAFVVAVCAGVGWASLLPGQGADASGSRRLVSQPTEQLGLRFDVWQDAAAALRESPLLGVGPGRFGAAVTPRMDLDTGRALATATFDDAHNIVVEIVTTTGLLGGAVAAAFALTAIRRGGGPLRSFGLILLVAALVEPLSITTTPLALLALGASAARGTATRNRLVLPLAALGALAGAVLLVGEFHWQRAEVDFAPSSANLALRLLPPWPEVSLTATKVDVFYAKSSEEKREAIERARGAVLRDPQNHAAWARLGSLEGVWGDEGRASLAFAESLALHPWYRPALEGKAKSSRAIGDEAGAAHACRRLELLVPGSDCGRLPGSRSRADFFRDAREDAVDEAP